MKNKFFFEDNLNVLKILLKDKKVVVITDTNVYDIYAEKIPFENIIQISSGEEYKNLHTVEKIIFKLLELEADRDTVLVGIGGGIVTDITGFTASIFMRGMKFALVPTTLLGQVDAAIGGKNGVNFTGFKNILGSFSNPEFVLINNSFLETLSDMELKNGYAEIIKYGLILDIELFELLEKETINQDLLKKIIKKCIDHKISVVEKDFKDKNYRKILNFGHTIGHAIEKETNFPHGQAISIGFIQAANLSLKEGLLSEEEFFRIMQILIKFELPFDVQEDYEKILGNIGKDKKKSGENIDYILLEGIGKSKIKSYNIAGLKKNLYDLH